MKAPDSPFEHADSSLNRICTWVAVVFLLFTMPLVFNFLGRVQAETKVNEAVEIRSESVAKGERTLTQLKLALEYAKSDAFTERYAREQARYARRGEVAVIPAGALDTTRPNYVWWQDFVKLDASLTVSDTVR
jgi:hypothetical protein